MTVTDGNATRVEADVPALGESVTEVVFGGRRCRLGDLVAYGSTLAEVSTDKVDSEIVASVDGRLAGQLARPGAELAWATSSP
jgi:pyruvate/2-oxoglutarate dehydrogenase complex dihydrolipoamide acyltransferase (E2) component